MAQISTRKRGNTWEYSFEIASVNGKRKRKSKGGFRTKKECLEAGTIAKADYDRGLVKVTPKNLMTNDFLRDWYEKEIVSKDKLNTVVGYDNMLRNYIYPYFEGIKLIDVTPAVCQNFLNHLIGKNISQGYTDTIKRLFSGALSYAVFPMEYIPQNPFRYIKYKRPKPKIETIDFNTYNLILDSISARCNYYYVPFNIAWYTGMRIGEVCALEWNDVDFENKTIAVNKTMVEKGKIVKIETPKSESSNRSILVSDTLINQLKEWRQTQINNAKELSEPTPVNVCTRNDLTIIRPSSISQYCIKISKWLDIDFHFHILRHTHATMLIQNGASIKDVQIRLGHANVTTTLNTYTHKDDEASKRSVNILDSLSTL